jgi:hypothetical protein
MDALSVAEAVAGGCLLFFVPGYTVAKAVFPERRLSGPEGVRWGIELVALALVLSVVLTVAVGYLLLAGAPTGFRATWGDPLLESALAAIAVVAFTAGWLEGAYARMPPARRITAEPGGAGAWELSDRLGRLQRERQGLERELRRALASDDDARARIRSRLEHVLEEEQELRRRREGEYEL